MFEPVTKAGPLYDHLRRFGTGVHHLGMEVTSGIDAVRAELQTKDGKWTGGAKGGNWAFVDFRHTPLGITVEVGPVASVTAKPPAKPTGLLGGLPIIHIGWASADSEASVRKIADVFGVDYPAVWRPYERDIPLPPAMPWSSQAWLRTVMPITANNLGMEMTQGGGAPNPWAAHVAKQKGTAFHHLAVNRGSLPREDWLRIGQEKGAAWTAGGPPPEGSWFYLDWTDTLGFAIEVI